MSKEPEKQDDILSWELFFYEGVFLANLWVSRGPKFHSEHITYTLVTHVIQNCYSHGRREPRRAATPI